MELSRHDEREAAVLDEYAALIQPHIAQSAGRMVLLDADPGRYDAQQLDVHHVAGDPQRAGMVELVATQAAPDSFPQMLETVRAPENQQLIKSMGEILKRGDNVMLVTNHSDLIDIALTYAAVYSRLDEQEYSFQSGMIISKIISRLGYILDAEHPAIPAVDALKLGCNDVMLSFPRTPSMQKSKVFEFVPDHIDRHNRKLRSTIRDRQAADEGYLLAVAGSGATDKPRPDQPNTINMTGLTEGTIKMMRDRHTYVVPVAVWLRGERAVMEFCNLRAVTTPAEGHQVMVDIQDTLNERVESHHFQYRGETTAQQLGAAAIGQPSLRQEQQHHQT